MRHLRMFAFLPLFVASNSAFSESPYYIVDKWCFAREINEVSRQPIGCLSDPSYADGTKKLYLWMNVKVSKMGLKYLRRFKKLPMLHVWGRDGYIEGREIDIGVTTRDWSSKEPEIESEFVLRDEYFDWATWSEKVEYVYDGKHFVSILDSEHRGVALSGSNYDAFLPTLHITRR